MEQILTYTPGQKATLFLELKDVDGYRADSLTTPVISSILSFTSTDGYTAYDGYLATDGYNKPFTKISIGLYFAQITLPKTASSVGSYFVTAQYTNPINSYPNTNTYQIIVNAPYGIYTSTVG